MLSGTAPGQELVEPISASGPEVIAAAIGNEVVFQEQTQLDNFYKPNVITFDFPIDPNAVNGRIDITALSDLNSQSEIVAFNAEGIVVLDLFTEPDDSVRPFTATINLSDIDLALLAADGNLHMVFTPNSSVDDFRNVDEYVTVGLTYEIPSTPIMLSPVTPRITGAYTGSANGELTTPTETDGYRLDLEAGQSLRLEGIPAQDLVISIEVIDPLGTTIYTGISDAAGEALLDQAFALTNDGPYTIRVSSDGATQSLYALNVFVNEAIEDESIGGPSNDTLAAAQSLDDQFRDIGSGMQLATFRGTTSGYIPIGHPDLTSTLSESFESGTLPANWSATSDPFGRIRILDTYGASDGSYAMLMDSSSSRQTLNEATWTVDLSNIGSAVLSFDYTEWGNDSRSLPTNFTGSYNGDGVSISDDGINWYTILNSPDTPHGEWQRAEFNLIAEAINAGLTPGPDFKIKFQKVVTFYLPFRGGGFDNIRLETSQVQTALSPLPDFYKVTLAADQFVSLSVTDVSGSPISFKLYDPLGAYIPNTTFSSPDGRAAFYDFKPMLAGEYTIEVTEGQDEYWLSILLDGTLEAEGNDDLTQAQKIGRTGAVFGTIDVQAQKDYYKVSAVAGDNLVFESGTPGRNFTDWDVMLPLLELYDPTGAFVELAAWNAPDGINAVLSHTALLTGDYTLVVRDNSNTLTGLYTIQASGFTGAQDEPFEVIYSTIQDGHIYNKTSSLPYPYRLTMSGPTLSHSLSVDDMTINGVAPTKASIYWSTNDIAFTIQLASPVDGDYIVDIPAGAFRDLHGVYNEPFTLQFTIDTVPPTIIESSVLEGDIVPAGDITITLKFSEAMKTINGVPENLLFLYGNDANYSESFIGYDPVTHELTVSYDGIVAEGLYTFSLGAYSYYLTDLAGNRLDGEPDPVTTVPTGDGGSQGNFFVNFGVEDSVAQPLEPAEPISSLATFAHRRAFSGISQFQGDEDRFTFDLTAGQTFSVVPDHVPGLVEFEVELYNPLGALVAQTSDGVLALNNLVAGETGTHTILVRSVVQPEEEYYPEHIDHKLIYSGEVLFGAVSEAEEIGGSSNDSLATAQDLAPAMRTLGGGVQQAVILGGRQRPNDDFVESFESGVLGPDWSANSYGSSASLGRIEVTDVEPAADGNYALLMDKSTSSGSYVLNEAIWTVDLRDYPDARITFAVFDWFEQRHSLPSEFTGHYDGDGVSFSDDGVNWHTYISNPSGFGVEWDDYIFSTSLAGAAHAAGVELGPNFRIKFQQYDNEPRPNDGVGYDNIRISATPVTPTTLPDVYSLSLAAGDQLSITLDGGVQADALELLDSTGQILAYGDSGWRDASGSIRSFIAPTDGTYYVRVTQADGDYTLIATLDANYVPETINYNTQYDIGPDGEVIGSLYQTTDIDRYLFNANAGDEITLWSQTPNPWPVSSPNTLDTFIELYDPSNQLVASSGTGGDGPNALLNHTITTTGTYRIQISSELNTIGGYLLNVTGNTGATAFSATANIADGQAFNHPPTQAQIAFSEPVRLDTLSPSDILVDGVPITAFTNIIDKTVYFDLPALTEGTHTLSIPADAVTSLAGVPLEPFASQFSIDSVAPRVIASSVQAGDVLSPGEFTVTIQFDEELDAGNLSVYDALLSRTDRFEQTQPETLTYDPVGSILTLGFGAIEEGPHEFKLFDGVFDLAFNALDGEYPAGPLPPNISGDGVRGGNFVFAFDVDRGPTSPPVALQTIPLFGSLAAGSFRNTGLILDADDTDPFSVYMQTGQVLSALLRPVGPGRFALPGSVLSLSAPGVTVVAPGPDEPVRLTYTHTGPAGQVELIVGNSVFNRGTEYGLDIYLNALLEDTLPQSVSVPGPALDLGPALVGVPGSAVDVATVIGTGQVSKTLGTFGNVVANNQLTFDFTDMPLPVGDGIFTITATADLGSFQEGLSVFIGSLSTGATRIGDFFFSGGSEIVAVIDQTTIDQALLTSKLVDGVITFTVIPSFGVEDLGYNEMTIGLAYPGLVIDPVDTYAIDLQAGQLLSVFVDSDPGNFVVEIVDADSGVILAQPGSAGGYDALLEGWVAPTAGTYLVRVVAQEHAEYRLSIVRGAVLNTDTGGLAGAPLPLLEDTGAALGYLQTLGPPRLFAMTGQVTFPFLTPGVIELDPTTLLPINQFTVGGTQGALTGGVNTLAYSGGALYAGAMPIDNVPPGPGIIYALDPDSGEIVSSFTTDQVGVDRGHLLAAFGNELIVQDSGGDLVFINPTEATMTRRVPTVGIGYASAIAGAADRGTVFLAGFGSGGVTSVVEIDAFSGSQVNLLSLPLSRIDSAAYVNGQLYVYDMNLGILSVFDPDTGALIETVSSGMLDIVGVGGDGVAPTPDVDRYSLTLSPGERITLRTSTPFDAPGGLPANSLDPGIRVLDPNGVEVAFNDNSAGDGKNALLTFTAVAGGEYTVEVSAVVGRGEYLLDVDRAPFLFGDLTGDGFVGVDDLNIVLAQWNQVVPVGDLSGGDASGDGFIGVDDLNAVLGNWNASPPPPVIEGDATGDGFVGVDDLNVLLANWNTDGSSDTRSDLTGDGFVGVDDLNLMLTNWNAGTPPTSAEVAMLIQQSATHEPIEIATTEVQSQAETQPSSNTDPLPFSEADNTGHPHRARRTRRSTSQPTLVVDAEADTQRAKSSLNSDTRTAVAAWSQHQKSTGREGIDQAYTPWSLRHESPASPLGLWEDL